MIVVVVYCNGYVILLCCLHYFNMLNDEINTLTCGKINKLVFYFNSAKN